MFCKLVVEIIKVFCIVLRIILLEGMICLVIVKFCWFDYYWMELKLNFFCEKVIIKYLIILLK